MIEEQFNNIVTCGKVLDENGTDITSEIFEFMKQIISQAKQEERERIIGNITELIYGEKSYNTCQGYLVINSGDIEEKLDELKTNK